VFFVSHNMHAVTRLCPRTILLNEGEILRDGTSHEVIATYLQSGLNTTAMREWHDVVKAPGNDIVRLRAVRVRTEEGRISEAVDIRQPVGVEMEYDVLEAGHVLVPNYHFVNEEGVSVFYAIENDSEWRGRSRQVGHYISTVWIPGNLLSEGTMIADAAISTLTPLTTHLFEASAVAFQVIDSLEGDSARGDFAGPILGVVRPMFRWTNQFIANE
jgi:lipopolysaccharide transport system ATP-binding protein